MCDECDATVAVLKALADPTRLRLLQLLARQSEQQALCVRALACRLGVSQPAVSQHLAILRRLELVRAEKRGVRTHYYLDRDRLREHLTAAGGLLGLAP
jgi:ArsR family transcriptional regulator